MSVRSWVPGKPVLLAVSLLLAGCSSGAATSSPAAPGASSGVTPAATAPAIAAATTPAPTLPASACSPAHAFGTVFTIATCQITAPSLAGNMLGDAPVLDAFVLAPNNYPTATTQRYPVVYVLTGFTDPAAGLAYNLAGTPDSAPGKTPPIVVVVSGVNALGGGFYVNSPVSGNWDDAITKDLVGYMDANFRTLATAASRGIAGHSMGGFGALNLAMRHPDVFSVAFGEAPGLFDATGAADAFGADTTVASVLDLEKQVEGKTVAAGATEIAASSSTDFGVQFSFAYGTAFAPDPKSPTLMRYPFKTVDGKTVRDDAVWATWEAGFGNQQERIHQYMSKSALLKGIALDWGTADESPWIPKGCAAFADQLKAAGISVTTSTFDGGHSDHLGERMVHTMLPFMQSNLADK